MANGAAALSLVDLPPTAPCAEVDTRNEVEQRIGEAVAAATIMTFAGMQEVLDGGLAATTRARAGNLFVQLYELQAHLGAIDFAAVARVQAKRILWARYGAAMREHLRYSEVELDRALDTLIGRPLDVLAKITAVERALVN
jgi:hypothetical protein